MLLLTPFEAYCQQVCLHVHCTHDHPLITAELTAHMEDRWDAFLRAGLSQEEAAQKTIKAMGDPVEVGRLMNRAHPFRWSVLRMFCYCLLLVSICLIANAVTRASMDRFLPGVSIWGKAAATFPIHQQVDLDGITLSIRTGKLYYDWTGDDRDGDTFRLQLTSQVTSGWMYRNGTGADDFWKAARFTDDLGNTYEVTGPYLEGLPRDASVLYVDYDRYDRSFHLEIPIDWGDLP